jgi:uncharacterized protein (TIGR02284 family)
MADPGTTIKELIQTLEDGRDGFAKAAERLAHNSAPETSQRFREYSTQRAAMADELRRVAQLEGFEVPTTGTVAGAMHRGWMAVKDALTGDDADAIIAAAEQGEDHAKAKFRDALADGGLSPAARSIVESQAARVGAAHDYVSSLKHAARS